MHEMHRQTSPKPPLRAQASRRSSGTGLAPNDPPEVRTNLGVDGDGKKKG